MVYRFCWVISKVEQSINLKISSGKLINLLLQNLQTSQKHQLFLQLIALLFISDNLNSQRSNKVVTNYKSKPFIEQNAYILCILSSVWWAQVFVLNSFQLIGVIMTGNISIKSCYGSLRFGKGCKFFHAKVLYCCSFICHLVFFKFYFWCLM